MNNIEILEEFIEQYNASYPEEKEWVAIYPEQIEAIENLIKENKELKEKLNKIKKLCNTKPYVAYTLYGDLLHESDNILKIIKGE